MHFSFEQLLTAVDFHFPMIIEKKRDRHHQKWESGAWAHDRSGKPEKTSREIMQQVAFHREELLLHGNAHSVRYEEMILDGSGKPEKFNHQEEAKFRNFRHGQ